jgi:L-seryl-tRNA(Ser) seleniumtransferase
MPDEVILQDTHRYVYEHAVRSSGARLVGVHDAEDMAKAINPKTAMMLFYYGREKEGKVKAKEFVAIGKKFNVPTFCDGATTVPPATNIHRLVNTGFDLICFSGGKGLKGPYSAGLLLGRKNLIKAARLNGSPHDDTIGRGMKVSKEELLGMLVALEKSLAYDATEDWERKKLWINLIADRVTTIPGVQAKMFIPEIAGHQPHLRLTWDEFKINITRKEAVRQLREGNPSIEVCSFVLTKGEFELSAWMLEPGEAEVVADRIHAVLSKALHR